MTTRTLATPLPAHDAYWLADTFARNRALYGGFRMEDPPADPPPSNDPPADPPADPPPADPPPSNDPPKKLELTQAELDKMIGDRLSKEKAKYDQQIKDLQDSAGKTEVQKLTAERDRFKEQAEGAPKTYGPRLAKTEAKLAAMVAKGRTDRLTQIVAQADLEDCVGDDGEVDEAKVKTAVEKVLTDFPEWKATAGASGNDLGAGDDGKKKPTFTRKQIQEMSDEERVKRLPEINLAMAEGRISG